MNPLEFLNTLSPFDEKYSLSRTVTDRPFFLKDLYTEGLWAVKRQRRPATAVLDSLEIVEGFKLLDNAEDEETGRPHRDYYLWYALGRLMLVAGDLVNAAVYVEHRYASGTGPMVGGGWRFGFALPTTRSFNGAGTGHQVRSFLTVHPVDTATVTVKTLDEALLGALDSDTPVRYKAMGPIDPTHLFVKVGSYPMAVHPGLKNRSVATQLPYNLLGTLVENTGLQILQHWQPEDTSANPGVYLLSDGVDSYLMVYDAPALRDCLIEIDAAVGREEEDGAIVADPTAQFSAVVPGDELDEPGVAYRASESEHGATDVDSSEEAQPGVLDLDETA